MLYGLFNGLQAYWTGDDVYFFMDFTVKSTPLIAIGLSGILCCSYGVACTLSALKWKLMGSGAARRSRERREHTRPLSKEEEARRYLLAAAEEEANFVDRPDSGYVLWEGHASNSNGTATRAHR